MLGCVGFITCQIKQLVDADDDGKVAATPLKRGNDGTEKPKATKTEDVNNHFVAFTTIGEHMYIIDGVIGSKIYKASKRCLHNMFSDATARAYLENELSQPFGEVESFR